LGRWFTQPWEKSLATINAYFLLLLSIQKLQISFHVVLSSLEYSPKSLEMPFFSKLGREIEGPFEDDNKKDKKDKEGKRHKEGKQDDTQRGNKDPEPRRLCNCGQFPSQSFARAALAGDVVDVCSQGVSSLGFREKNSFFGISADVIEFNVWKHRRLCCSHDSTSRPRTCLVMALKF